MKILKELVRRHRIFHNAVVINNNYVAQLSNDPTLSSLPLLSTFLKSYARPYLGIAPPTAKQQISDNVEPGNLAPVTQQQSSATSDNFPELGREEDELVEKEIRTRFKKMCEGYFDSVSKKLVMEHKVIHRPSAPSLNLP